MNETILNGLINLFAIFASLAKIPHEKARAALTSYLTSHFGIRSNQEYLDLFDETQSIYDDPDFEIDKQMVILCVIPCVTLHSHYTTLHFFFRFYYECSSFSFFYPGKRLRVYTLHNSKKAVTAD